MTIFSNWLHIFRNTLLALFLTLPLLSNTYAASSANIEVTHCIADCGKVLVGAARIDFNGIRWNTQETVANVTLEITGADYGFTGNSLYLSDMPPSFGTFWRFNSIKQVSIGGPPYGTTMNHFFAPSQSPVSIMGPHRYSLSPTDSKSFTATGEGVADNNTAPAITLDVQTSPVNTCGANNPCPVIVVAKGTVRFTVTPRLNSALVPAAVLPIKYTLINLRAEEKNTTCSRGNLTFADRGLGNNSFKDGDYYHYLEPGSPNYTPQTCSRNYQFLVSVDKSFSFQATNNRDTGTGYVEYVFYVNGHYDPNNPNLTQYPGSWKSLRLTTNTQVVVSPPVATFTATPPSGQTPLTVNLDISGSSGTPAWTVTKNSQPTKLMPTLATGNQYTLTLSEAGNYDLTLITIAADGKQSTPATRSVTVTAPPVVEECGLPTYNPTDVSAALPCVIIGNQPQQVSLTYQGTTDYGYYWKVFYNNSTCKDNVSATRCLTPNSNGEVKIVQAKMTDGQDLVVTDPIVFKPFSKDTIQYWEYIPTTISDTQANFATVQNVLTDGTTTVDLIGALLALPEGKTENDYQYQWEITNSHHQTVILQPGNYTIKLNVTDTQGNIVDTVSQQITVSSEQTSSNYNLFLDQGIYLAQISLPPSSDSPLEQLEQSWSLKITAAPENYLNKYGFTVGAFTPVLIEGELSNETSIDPIRKGENDINTHEWSDSTSLVSEIKLIKVNGWLNSTQGGHVLFEVASPQRIEFQVSGAKPLDFKIFKDDGGYKIIYPSPK